MITEIIEKTVVRGGRIDLPILDFPDGTEVEVLVRAEDESGDEMDTTEYLLSTEANREHLLAAIRDARDHPEKMIPFDLEEYEKRIASS